MLDIGLGSNVPMRGTRIGRKDEGEAIAYARVVIPLGERPERIDCKRLYDLEIQRLEMEIELMKMGMN